MRIFIRYFIFILLISFISLRLIVHPTNLQNESVVEKKHQYFQPAQGEPLKPDQEIIGFERDDHIIVYYAFWHEGAHYRVNCVLAYDMAMHCESVIHYGLVRVPATDRYVFNWDQ